MYFLFLNVLLLKTLEEVRGIVHKESRLIYVKGLVKALPASPASWRKPFFFWCNIHLETSHMKPLYCTVRVVTANQIASFYVSLAVTPRTFLIIIIFDTMKLSWKCRWLCEPLSKQLWEKGHRIYSPSACNSLFLHTTKSQ